MWIIGRTKTDGPSDYASVHAIQDGYQINRLSDWISGKKTPVQPVKVDPSIDMETPSLDQVNAMSPKEYFTLAVSLLKNNPPHLSDWSQISRMENIGIKPGQEFHYDKLEAGVKTALERGKTASIELIKSKTSSMGRMTNGWLMNTDTMGVYGNYYLKRAFVTMVGLGANQAEDAIYPMAVTDADGKPLNGESNYVLHFDAGKLPPTNAFWSITMYDNDGFQCANELNRFTLSSWMPLKKNSDGSLDIYIQHKNPGAEKESNWLPAPGGILGVTMRLYSPCAEVLTGDWNPPAIKRV